MKCLIKKKEVIRVSDAKAASLVKAGWKYCAKAVWKAHVRN